VGKNGTTPYAAANGVNDGQDTPSGPTGPDVGQYAGETYTVIAGNFVFIQPWNANIPLAGPVTISNNSSWYWNYSDADYGPTGGNL
jgi:hypothetical protein